MQAVTGALIADMEIADLQARATVDVAPSAEWPELEPVSAERWKRMKPIDRRLEQWRRAQGLPHRCPEGRAE